MSVTITSGQELKDKLIKGINLLGDTVSATLGSSGRPVAIRDEHGTIRITKDGYSVANAITSVEDPISDMALQLGKAAAKKTVDEAGDGTTTTTLLVQSIVTECLEITGKSVNIVEVQKGIAASVEAVIANLKEQALEVTTEDQINQVARLSANGDEVIAKLISTSIDKAGRDGSISIEESKGIDDSLEEVEGMVIGKGLTSHHFITDQEKGHSLLLNPYILIVDEMINTAEAIVPFMTYAAEKERSLLIIAEGVESAAFSTVIVNHLRGNIKAAIIKSPDFADRKKAILEDLAIMTGATVLTKDKGIILAKVKPNEVVGYLGECRSATITSRDTTIIDGKGDKDKIEERLLAIKGQIDNAKSAFEKENLQDRLGKMLGGVVIINVGGKSEVEMKERRDRVEDALFATKAAIAEGVVPGGGLALINTESALYSLVLPNKDQELGKNVIRKVLYAPFKKILLNAGIENHYEILTGIQVNKGKGITALFDKSFKGEEPTSDRDYLWQGYNVKTGEYGNVQDMGILDPVKVTRIALQNASSTASILMTIAAGVNEAKTPELVGTQNY